MLQIDDKPPTRPLAFLASTWDSATLKQARINARQNSMIDERGHIWVAEVDAKHLKPDLVPDQLVIVDACLDAIEDAKNFVLVDNGSYGTNLADGKSVTDTSFLELELFQAVLLNKPIFYIFVGQRMGNSGLYKLLNQILPLGYVSRIFGDIEAAFSALPDIIGAKVPSFQRGRQLVFGTSVDRFTQRLTKERVDYSMLFGEPEFLIGWLCGPVSGKADLDAAEHYLNLAKNETKTNRKLSRLWIAIRALMSFHYAETKEPRALALWERALSQWSEAAAWRGLHAHLWLGNVSALGSIARVREALGTIQPNYSGKSSDELVGAFASVYLSISKRVPLLMRHQLLARAEGYIARGIETLGPDSAQSLLPMRGSINFRKLKFRAAAKDYQAALDIASSKDPDSADTGFLLTELGFAEVFNLKPRAGLQKIEEGLNIMERGGSSPGFRTRAHRKHALVSAGNLALREARLSAREADRIAIKHGLLDQRTRLNLLLAYGRKGKGD